MKWEHMDRIEFKWTDGSDESFRRFYIETENYYSQIVGGEKNRQEFAPYNLSNTISDVIIAYSNGKPVGCAGLKKYSDSDIEIKRVWVEPESRGQKIASRMLNLIEEKARQMNYRRTILQTRPMMTDAVRLYENRGYSIIDNYPPYDRLEGAICMALGL